MKVPDFIVDSILMDMEGYGLKPSHVCPHEYQACDDYLLEIARDMAETIWLKLQQRIALEIKESLDLKADNLSATLTAELKYHDTRDLIAPMPEPQFNPPSFRPYYGPVF